MDQTQTQISIGKKIFYSIKNYFIINPNPCLNLGQCVHVCEFKPKTQFT